MPALSTLSRHAALPLALVATLFALEGCMMARPAPAPTPRGGGNASITMVNRTNLPVYYVYISPCSSSSWGNDQLNSAEVVMPNATRTFRMSAGCWDLKARFRDGQELEERQVTMTAGGTRTWTLSN